MGYFLRVFFLTTLLMSGPIGHAQEQPDTGNHPPTMGAPMDVPAGVDVPAQMPTPPMYPMDAHQMPAVEPITQAPTDNIPAAPEANTPAATPPETIQSPAHLIKEDTSGTQPYAIVKTSMGRITIRLYYKFAPRTVDNFISLARGEKEFIDVKTGRKVTRPFYDGLIFHKVIPGFIIQAGCPFGNGTGGPGFKIPDEIDPMLRHDKPGIVGMANYGTDTNGSQFYITLEPRPDLDKKYSIFGEVVEGMDVVRKINRLRRGPTDKPLTLVTIESIAIEER